MSLRSILKGIGCVRSSFNFSIRIEQAVVTNPFAALFHNRSYGKCTLDSYLISR